MKNKLQKVFSFVLVALTAVVSAILFLPSFSFAAPTITTDKATYAVGESVVFKLSGFPANTEYIINKLNLLRDQTVYSDGSLPSGDGVASVSTITTSTGTSTYQVKYGTGYKTAGPTVKITVNTTSSAGGGGSTNKSLTISTVWSCPPNSLGSDCNTLLGNLTPGHEVIINGTGFTSQPANPVVKIGTVNLTVTSAVADRIEALIPSTIPAGNAVLTVTSGLGTATKSVKIASAQPPGGGGSTVGGGGGGNAGGNPGTSGAKLQASPTTFRVGQVANVQFVLSGGPPNGRYCIYIEWLADELGTCTATDKYSGQLGPTGLGNMQLSVPGLSLAGTTRYSALVFDQNGRQVDDLDSFNTVTFINPNAGGGAGGGAGGCDYNADPNCGTGGGAGGGGGGDPTGLIGEGLTGIKDKFETGGILTGSTSLGELISNVIEVILGIVLAIAMLMIIIGGYFYITSAGDPKQAERGKKTVTYAIIGIVFIILSYTIVFVVNEFLISG